VKGQADGRKNCLLFFMSKPGEKLVFFLTNTIALKKEF
jgi:hypothetical protein